MIEWIMSIEKKSAQMLMYSVICMKHTFENVWFDFGGQGWTVTNEYWSMFMLKLIQQNVLSKKMSSDLLLLKSIFVLPINGKEQMNAWMYILLNLTSKWPIDWVTIVTNFYAVIDEPLKPKHLIRIHHILFFQCHHMYTLSELSIWPKFNNLLYIIWYAPHTPILFTIFLSVHIQNSFTTLLSSLKISNYKTVQFNSFCVFLYKLWYQR